MDYWGAAVSGKKFYAGPIFRSFCRNYWDLLRARTKVVTRDAIGFLRISEFFSEIPNSSYFLFFPFFLCITEDVARVDENVLSKSAPSPSGSAPRNLITDRRRHQLAQLVVLFPNQGWELCIVLCLE